MEQILNRIRKMLALARDSGASEGEVENALRLAQELMEKHNIDNAEVLSSPTEAPKVGESATGIKANPLTRDVMRVVCAVCNTKNYKTAEDAKLVIYGYPTDVAVCKEMYHELFATVRAMVRARFGLGWSDKHNSYCIGFLESCYAKAKAAATSTAVSNTGSAIVLVRDSRFKDFEKDIGIVFVKARRREVNESAYNKGRSDGANIDLSRDNRFANPVKRMY